MTGFVSLGSNFAADFKIINFDNLPRISRIYTDTRKFKH